MNTLLAGLRACGKSTVGRRLAALLGQPFVELDERTLARTGAASVSEVWQTRGEPAWRAAEAEALAACLEHDGQVVALGGGTPTVEAARHHIETARAAGRARLVYLLCSREELARRLARDPGDRPPLTGSSPAEEIDAVAEARDPIYRALADLVVDVSTLDAVEAAREVARRLT
jgi:shikimate kinase